MFELKQSAARLDKISSQERIIKPAVCAEHALLELLETGNGIA